MVEAKSSFLVPIDFKISNREFLKSTKITLKVVANADEE
jgi:hypothetical protein